MALREIDLFGIETLSGVVSKFADAAAPGGPNTQIQTIFRSGDPEFTTTGEEIGWDELSYSRKPGGFGERNSPAKLIAPLARTRKFARMADIKLKSFIPGSEYLGGVRGMGGLAEERAQAVVARHVKELMTKIMLTREELAADALQGSIAVTATKYPDTDMIFPTVTYAVNTLTAGAAWTAASTKILSSTSEVYAIKDKFITTAGLMVGRGMMNAKTSLQLINNTEIKDWAAGTEFGVSLVKSGSITKGTPIADLDFQVFDGGYVNGSDSFTRFIADDKIIFLPSSEEEAGLKWAEGYGILPGNAVVAPSPDGLMPKHAPSAGWYSYAYASNDPVGVYIVVGYRGFPIIQRPDAIVLFDTTP